MNENIESKNNDNLWYYLVCEKKICSEISSLIITNKNIIIIFFLYRYQDCIINFSVRFYYKSTENGIVKL